MYQFIKEVIFSIGFKESTFVHSRAATDTRIKTRQKSQNDYFKIDNLTDFDMQLGSFFDKYLHQPLVLVYLELFFRSRIIDRAERFHFYDYFIHNQNQGSQDHRVWGPTTPNWSSSGLVRDFQFLLVLDQSVLARESLSKKATYL